MNNSSLCVDASLVIRLLVAPRSESVVRLWEKWDAERRRIVAPTLLYYEVANALYRYQKHGLLIPSSVQLLLEAVLAIPIDLHAETELHSQALVLADKLSLPAAYDAHYLALAEKLGIEFWTADGRLGQAAHGILPWVHVV